MPSSSYLRLTAEPWLATLANASLFANAGSRGIPIAVASGGIVGEPAMTNYNFELKLSGRIDLRGGSLDVTNLMGSPDVTNAAPFEVAGLWTVEDDTPMTVTGTLAFRSGARVKIADESLFASVGREGRAIATATGGIVGIPEIESYDYALKLSADGKSLIVYDNIPDVADWTVFTHKATVTFGGVQQGVVLTNFPVLVKLSTAIPDFSYSDFRRPDGAELRFTDADGKYIPHEIEAWDTNGVSTVWVKVPMLDATTSITAKYGCTGTPPSVDPKDVWDDGYLGVWHLGAASGESVQPDSTRNQKSFAVNTNNSDGVASGADGVVGRSAATGLRSDGKGCFSYSDGDKFFAGRSAFTVEAWTRQDDSEPAQNPTSRYVLAHSGQTETSYDWRLYETSDGRMAFQMYNVGGSAEITSDEDAARPDRNAWNHTAFAWDGSSGQLGLYLGGVPLNIESSVLTNNWTGVMADGKSGFNLGNHRYDNTKSFKGQIDEVRISKVVRSADWIKATYDTIANANFATYSTTAGTLTGYAAWANAKELAGGFEAADAKGIANGVRYAFDIDPEKGPDKIGVPIIQVVRDANGNPCVQARGLASGRSDVTFGILATQDLSDWSNAVLIQMKKFDSDSFWKPSASANSGYIYPDKMFFKYTIEVK